MHHSVHDKGSVSTLQLYVPVLAGHVQENWFHAYMKVSISKRAETNGQAALGKYTGGVAGTAGGESNYVEKHSY